MIRYQKLPDKKAEPGSEPGSTSVQKMFQKAKLLNSWQGGESVTNNLADTKASEEGGVQP